MEPTESEVIRPTEDLLRDVVESRRPGAPLLAQIGDRGDVVAKHCHRGYGQKGLEVEKTPSHRQQLPGIDRKKSLRLVPKAGNHQAAQVSPPADVGSVRPKVQI